MTADKSQNLTRMLKGEAQRLGFDVVGIAPAVPLPESHDAFTAWIGEGCAADMSYLVRHTEARRDPRAILPGAKSIAVVGVRYDDADVREAESASPRRPREGVVSAYARREDYHDRLRDGLKQLGMYVRSLCGDARVRGVVDTAPLLERAYAVRAGLGSIGKNTMLIHPKLGNRLLLGALLTTEPLVDDEPVAFDPCGQCRRCLNACPTGALDRPHHLDARRCLSYWTIEQAGPIPREWETLLGDCVFGCDRCQDACPWSHVGRGNDLKSTSLLPLREDLRRLDLIELLSLDNDAFQRRFSGTPITRAGRNGLLRSVALVLGARLRRAFDDEIAAVLCRGLNDPSAVVRQACAAALCWCDRSEIRAVLSERLAVEEDERVRAALSRHSE